MAKRIRDLAFILSMVLLAEQVQSQTHRTTHLSIVKNTEVWSGSEKKALPVDENGKLFLIVLLSPECPMSVNYTLTLNQLKTKFDNQLTITGIIPGSTVTVEEVRNFSATYQIMYPLFRDKTLELTKKLKAEVTPEAFLFNASGDLVYSGAIDNWLTELGKKKQNPDQFFLLDAISATANGGPVARAYVKANGCLINDF